jgi:AcrR family transcriptional regulator
MSRIVKNSADRKSEIIHAASKLFLKKDYEKTTMQDIMNALGIAKGTIYHYFDSKEKLLEAVIIDRVDSHIAEIIEQLQNPNENALEKIKKLTECSNIAKKHPKILDHLHRSTNAAMHIGLLAETLIKLAPLYEMLIRQGCLEGLFQTEYPRECAEFLISAVQFLTDRGIYPWSKDDLERRVKAFPKLIEQQLGAASGSFQFIANHLN